MAFSFSEMGTIEGSRQVPYGYAGQGWELHLSLSVLCAVAEKCSLTDQIMLCPAQIPPRPCSSPWTTSIGSSGRTPREAMAHRGEAGPGLWGVREGGWCSDGMSMDFQFPLEGTSTIGSWMRPGKICFAHTPQQPVPVPSTAWPRRCSWAWQCWVQGGRSLSY